MGDFLIICSGADRAILALTPTDRSKYVGLGGAVLTTTVMAFVSCFFALHAMLGVDLAPAGGLAFLWAMAIFNLDRWLVSALKRRPTILGNVASFLPRLALAIVLGSVIAEPLVLTIFKSEIAKELVVMAQEDASQQAAGLANDVRFVGMPKMKARIDELQAVVNGKVDTAAVLRDPEVKDLAAKLAGKEDELRLAERAVICESQGNCGSMKSGIGPVTTLKEQYRDDVRAQRDELQRQLDAKKAEVGRRLAQQASASQASAAQELAKLKTTYATLDKQRTEAQAAFDGKNVAATGVLARMEALHRLAHHDGTLANAERAVRLFVIILDSLPVLVKFLMSLFPPSLYERVLERTEADQDELLAEELEDRHEMIRLTADVARREAQEQNQLEKDLAEMTAQKMIAAQGRLYDELLDLWEQDQLAAIRANPSAFIVT